METQLKSTEGLTSRQDLELFEDREEPVAALGRCDLARAALEIGPGKTARPTRGFSD
jgi:hypothetical protein